MPVDLKSITPDTSLPQTGVLFGADSQSAVSPSVYPVASVKDALNSGIATLTSEPAITWDAAVNPTATVTLTANATLYASNFKAGGTYKLIVFQDATGGRTLAYDPNFKWPNDTIPTVSAGANAMTVFEFVSNGTYLYGTVSQAYDGSPAPTVMGMFARPAGDYTTLSTLSSMPTGGTISRSGNAMVYDSTGKLTWAANNLFLWSQDFRNTATAGSSRPWSWGGTTTVATNVAGVTAPDGTSTASRVSGFSTSDGDVGLSQNVTIAPTRIVGSIYVRGEGADIGKKVLLRVKRIAGTAVSNDTEITLTGDWQRLSSSMTMAADNTGVQFILSGAAASNQASSCLIWGAQLEAVTYHGARDYLPTTSAARYEPRFDVDPATLQPKGLLVEGARTNLALYSQDFTNAVWTKFPSGTTTAVAGTVTSPDGISLSSYVTLTSASSNTYIYQNPNAAAGAITISCWARGSGTTRIGFYDGSTWQGISITLSSSWQRFTFTAIAAGTVTQAGIGIMGSISGSATALNFDVWGFQVERAAWASSYLPTGASTTSRAAETFTLTGYANRLIEAYWIEQETGVASSFPETVVSSGAVTINPPQFGWVTSLRAYTNAYAGDIATPSWIDNSGTNGNRMVTDSTGTLTWAPANMLLQSNFAASWSSVSATPTPNQTAPDGSTNAVLLTTTATGGYITQTVSSVSVNDGSTVIVSLYVKKSNVDFFLIRFRDRANVQHSAWFNINTGTAGSTSGTASSLTVTPADNGFFRISAVFAASTGVTNPFVLLWPCATNSGTSANGDAAIIFGAMLEQVTYQTRPRALIETSGSARFLPRYDFDAATTPASPRGMLIEEARTNLCLYSQDFTNAAWSKTDITIDAGSYLTPDGTTNRCLVIAGSAGTEALFPASALTVTVASPITFSVYAKYAGSDWLYIQLGGTGTERIRGWFNLATGVKGSTSVATPAASASNTMTPVGNGWYRCTLTGTLNGAGTTASPIIATMSADGSLTRVNGAAKYLWGAMLEAGAFATSYIHTTTGTSLRVADVVKLSGTALTTLQGSAISVIGEATVSAFVAGISNFVFSASDGTANNRFYSIAAASGAGNAAVVTGGVTQANMTTANTTTAGSPFRVAAAFANNNAAVVLNNGTVVPDTSLTMPVVSQAGLGYYNVSPNVFLNGCIRSYAIYNQRLPDATLKQKSAVGAAY